MAKAPSTSATKKNGHLTPKQIAKLREMLLDKREQLNGEVASLQRDAASSTESTETSKSPLNPAENASDTFEQDFAFLSIESEEKLLALVENALTRIKDGVYGLCDNCDAEIPLDRIEFMPWAGLCIACRELEERGELAEDRDANFEAQEGVVELNSSGDDSDD